MSAEIQTRDVPALSLRATFEPETLDRKARTVEVTWTTGARVLRGFWDRFWEELSLDPKHVHLERLNNGAPFLADHDMYRVADTPGVIESAWLTTEGGKSVGRAKVRFVREELDPEADKLFEKIADRIVTNCSVGYRVHKFEKVEEAEDGIPVMRAVSWTPHEVSAVTVGADAGAGFRSATRAEHNPCEIITRGEAPQKEKEMSETQTSAAPVKDEAARAAELNAVRDQERKAERERVAAITGMARKHNLTPEQERKLIDEGASVDHARAVVLDAIATRSEQAGGPGQTPSGAAERAHVTGGEDEKDKRVRGMSAWLFERANAGRIITLAQEDKQFGRRFKDVALEPGEFRGMSLVDMARACLERSGVKTSGMDKMQLVARAFTHRSSSYQTTSDFAVLFENVMGKLLLAAYATTPDTWRRFCGTDTVPDFRDSPRYRNGSFGVLDDLNEHGEFKSKAIPDGSKTSISTATKGNIIALTRQAIINDDMGALADLASRFGRAGKLTLESGVYALLAQNSGLGPTMSDGQPFFHANRANVNATGSALSVAGLDADRVVMGQQKDPSGNEILELRPAVLVVPLGLGGDARVHNEAQYDPTSNKLNVPNKVRGLVRDIVDTARLSGTRRYLFCDPAVAAAIKVVFLEGQGEEPVLESKDGWNVDGTEWKVRLDAKPQMFDPKGALTNAGA